MALSIPRKGRAPALVGGVNPAGRFQRSRRLLKLDLRFFRTPSPEIALSEAEIAAEAARGPTRDLCVQRRPARKTPYRGISRGIKWSLKIRARER